MVLYTGEPEKVRAAMDERARKAGAEGHKAGIIDFNGDAQEAARQFFSQLRAFDKDPDVDLIICASVPDEGIGEAVMDRMRKAAGNNIVSV